MFSHPKQVSFPETEDSLLLCTLGRKSHISTYYFHVNGSIGIVQKIDSEIRPDLGCTTLQTSSFFFMGAGFMTFVAHLTSRKFLYDKVGTGSLFRRGCFLTC